MRNCIIGTAGHVDHGKTSLIKALTGQDLDTHKEEKRRGITINNGFTELVFDDNSSVGVIDVPGHRDFIKNMIAGVSGIDLVIMVISAESGPERQTQEHLEILETLGVKRSVIAFTKADLMEEDELEMAVEFLKESYQGTLLQDAPVVAVSAHTGQGLDELRTTIAKELETLGDRDSDGPFRLYIDRKFIIKGHGTVVTGSVHSGAYKKGQPAYLLPSTKELKVRTIQRHGQEAQNTAAGDRCSLNLAGFDKNSLKRGQVISDRKLLKSSLIDAELHLFDNARIKNFWCDAIFYSGSVEMQVKLSLLSGANLKARERGFIQIHLPQEFPFCYGDKFILRNSSDTITMGGGTILDPQPLHHRRRKAVVLERLQKISANGLSDLCRYKIHESKAALSPMDLAEHLNAGVAEILRATEKNLSRISTVETDAGIFFAPKILIKEWENAILRHIEDYHILHVLKTDGMSLEELAGKFKTPTGRLHTSFLKTLLKHLVNEGALVESGSTWAKAGRNVLDNEKLQRYVNSVRDYYCGTGMYYYSHRILQEKMNEEGCNEETLRQVIAFLVKSDFLIRIDDDYIMAESVEDARRLLLAELVDNDEGLTVAEFRDLVEGNRKFCLRCFAVYEKQNLVLRRGDNRILTDKGRRQALELIKDQKSRCTP